MYLFSSISGIYNIYFLIIVDIKRDASYIYSVFSLTIQPPGSISASPSEAECSSKQLLQDPGYESPPNEVCVCVCVSMVPVHGLPSLDLYRIYIDY